MTFTIALAGKGGTGKTSISALLVRWLVQTGRGPVLAIDADPALNLHLALGLPKPTTLGEVREKLGEQASSGGPVGVSRADYLDRQVRLAIEEGDAVDLLAMGRPEGAGCYCAVNHLLRQIIDAVSGAYAYVVIDNEAGMEHLSRRTTRDVDLLILATDPSLRGVKTAEAMEELSRHLGIRVGKTVVVLNRARGDLSGPLKEALERLPIKLAGTVPEDPLLAEFDGVGRPLFELDGRSVACEAVGGIARQLVP